MAKAVPNSPSIPPEPAPASFEAALSELEMIVKAMEDTASAKSLTLEESLGAYQRGVALLQYCQQALTAAEQKIQLLEKDTLRDFTPAADEWTSNTDFAAWMLSIQTRTEDALDHRLPAKTIVPTRLHDAMRYATLGGGKRVRPLLAHAAGGIFDASLDALDAVSCAVEMIHAYSLVHDDLPCMDDDVLRRGRPTVHVEFDEATAMLAGDALQSLAFHVIAGPGLVTDAARQVHMIQLLALASGSRGMAGGQAVDLDSVGKTVTLEELEFMHIHKTGALIRAAVLLGAHCGNADSSALDKLSRFANRVGLLFQVVDDILDTEADTATLGKTAGKDEAQNKPTYVSLLSLKRAKALAAELRDDAHQTLNDFGSKAQRLHELTDFIVARTF